jgi:EmrB/QacA subfamily drug resistance transporter
MAVHTSPPKDATTIAGHAVDRSYLPLLLTLGLGVFAGALDLGVLSPALPALAKSFGVGPRDVAWIFTLYLLTNVVSIPIMTKLSDRNGRRPVYIACVTIFGLGSLLAILAPSFWVFLTARAIQAFGAGGIFPVATAAIADRVPQERRGAALGLVAATWGLAAILGPNVGGLVTHFFSWHWIFAANIPLAIVVIALARTYVPTTASRVRGPLDVAGIALLAFGLLCAMVGLSRLDASTASLGGNGITLGAVVLACAAFVLLALVERRAAEPVVSPKLFASRQITVTYALEVLIGILEGALFFIPAALVAAQHLSYAAAGAIAAIGAFVFVAVIPLAGRALDAMGSRLVLTAGTLFTAAGLLLFAFGVQSLALTIVSMLVAGVGFGALLGAPTRYIISNAVPATSRGSAIGLLSVFLIIGQIFGASLAGGVIGSHADAVAGFRAAYETFAAIAVVAALGTIALKSRAAERQTA